MTTIEQPFDTRIAAASPWRLNSLILRLEALAALGAGIALWLANDGSLLWLLPALLVPDLSMAGYVANSRVGAVTYNLIHNWVLAPALLGLGWWMGSDVLLLAGSVVLAHVGMDRAMGYGLKLPTDFRDTHLGRIGAK
ncbi:MAG TPA: DUF4260 domain-containing protein [Candidatus Limnocylindria bacterium]|nr:DUF4260 domain-containing protein [Candidatus Limnocylindria bacterium]